MTLGQRIAARRTVLGLTQADLADRLNVVKQTIGNYERGDRDPDLSTIERLAEALHTTPSALCGWDEACNTTSTTQEPSTAQITIIPGTTDLKRRKENKIMITLNDLLTIVDARQLRVIVPVTPRLKARITVNTRQTAELDDLIRLYGESPVFSAEPAHEGDVMEIELTQPYREDLALSALPKGGEAK